MIDSPSNGDLPGVVTGVDGGTRGQYDRPRGSRDNNDINAYNQSKGTGEGVE